MLFTKGWLCDVPACELFGAVVADALRTCLNVFVDWAVTVAAFTAVAFGLAECD